MLHRLWRRRALIAWSLVFTLLFNSFAPAYAGFTLPFGLDHVVKDKVNGEIYKRLGDALGMSDPLLLDQKTAFRKVKDIPDFHPTHISFALAQDLFKRLGAGDYSFDVLAFCAQWSIHAPAQGVGYKLGLTQGKFADVISTLLVRGSLLGVDPNQLQAVSWRIQGGVPIGTWSKEDKALADRVIPDYEDRLKGDLLQEYEQKYAQFRASVPVNALPSSLDEVLPKLGFVGKSILALKKARKTLEDKTLSAERLPDQLYEPQGDGLPRMLPANPPEAKPSVWVERSAGVYERLVILEGNLKVNRLDVRITPEALKAAKEDSLQLADKSGKGVKMAAAPVVGGTITLMDILFGGAVVTTAGTIQQVKHAQQAYSQGIQAQSLTITPHLDPGGGSRKDPELCQKFKEGRAAYEAEVQALAKVGQDMLALGDTPESVAQYLVARRLEIGKSFKTKTAELGQWIADRIYGRNVQTYGNPYGPTYDWFKERGFSDNTIIEKSSRSGGGDVIPQLLKEICGE